MMHGVTSNLLTTAHCKPTFGDSLDIIQVGAPQNRIMLSARLCGVASSISCHCVREGITTHN